VTELMESNEQLRKLSGAMEASPASIVITDLGGDIEYVNGAFLEASGYRIETDTIHSSNTGCGWVAWKRAPGAEDCTSNEKVPVIGAKPWRHRDTGGSWHSGAEFDLCGEAGGLVWLRLLAYGVPVMEAMKKLPEIEAILVAAWNAGAKEARDV